MSCMRSCGFKAFLLCASIHFCQQHNHLQKSLLILVPCIVCLFYITEMDIQLNLDKMFIKSVIYFVKYIET